MNTLNQIMYIGCWVVLVLYVLTTLAVFARRSCIGCAAAFLFACILSLDLSLFNFWFFGPSFLLHVLEIDLHASSVVGLLRNIFTSEAAKDIYLIGLGTFGGWLAVFNAASMMETGGCTSMNPHEHWRFTKYTLRSAYRLSEFLGFRDDDVIALPITMTAAKVCPDKKSVLPIYHGR